jgi:inositol-phosphate transport system ATP-binding protein
VLLLDEPLANLDAKLRLEMRSEVRRIQLETGITAILVTHDQVEAMSMCDRIAIMNEGEIIQVDTPVDMYDSPRTEFVAGFLGNPPLTYLRGTRTENGFALANSDLRIPLNRMGNLPAPGSPLSLGIRPENYGPRGDVIIAGRVSFIESQGREMLYDVTLSEGSVLRSIQPVNRDVSLGDKVAWSVVVERILVFGAEGERL